MKRKQKKTTNKEKKVSFMFYINMLSPVSMGEKELFFSLLKKIEK